MKPRIFVRDLSEKERQQLSAGLRSSDAFVLRRSQILLASARGDTVPSIAKALSCDEQTVRHAIHAFNQQGQIALQAGSSRPHHLGTVLQEDVTPEMFKAVLHRPPRDFGFETSLAAIRPGVPNALRIRAAIPGVVQFNHSSQGDHRASGHRHGLSQCAMTLQALVLHGSIPAPDYVRIASGMSHGLSPCCSLTTTLPLFYHLSSTPPHSLPRRKKTARDRLLSWASQAQQAATWAIGFLDEVWWSRFALPKAFAWQDEEQPVRLVEQKWQKADPDQKALACYGVLWQRGPAEAPIRDQMSLRFVDGRPVSDITTQFLDWCCTQLQAQGKRAWLLIWDNASWHSSKIVRTWIREHNSLVKQEDKGVRILPLFLPKQSPWLNPIEPKWVHGKRAVVEPNALLTAKQLAERICAYYHCSYETHLSIADKVS